MSKILALLSLCLATLPLLAAQVEGDWVAMQGPHIVEKDFQRLGGMLTYGNARSQELAISELRNLLRGGQTNASDTNLLTLVQNVSTIPLIRVQKNPRAAITVLPTTRLEMAAMLGLIGGRQAEDVLLEILRLEVDYSVVEEAYKSLRAIGVTKLSDLMNIMLIHAEDPFPNGPHDRLMQELVLTLRTVAKNSPNAIPENLFVSAFRISQNTRYLDSTRNLAAKVVRELMGLD